MPHASPFDTFVATKLDLQEMEARSTTGMSKGFQDVVKHLWIMGLDLT